MKIYEVHFAHKRYGANWMIERVAVRGWAQEAIAKARQRPDVKQYNGALRVEEVVLIAST